MNCGGETCRTFVKPALIGRLRFARGVLRLVMMGSAHVEEARRVNQSIVLVGISGGKHPV